MDTYIINKFRYGTNLALDKYITPGTVFSCFWAACGGANRLGQAIPQISVIMQAKMAAGEILSMIDMVFRFEILVFFKVQL